MAAPSEVNTRVDQLAADVARIRAQIRADLAPLDERPIFTTHPDGSVWTREGVQIRPPSKAAVP